MNNTVRYANGANLEYLNAVITEALRAHAATGFVTEREVPTSWVTIAENFILAGTVIGINSWVMHANKQMYGEDAETFRPERWFEDEQRVREMKRCNMAFGAGARVCIGGNISMVEIVKLVPTLMHAYDYRLVRSGTY
jgi:cytochrome P450